MKLNVHTVEELKGILNQDFYLNSSNIPITPQRADSHFHNPRANKTDKVLWCLIEEDQLLAYRLMLPDWIYVGEVKMQFAWLSCLWVHPAHRGKGYGKKVTQPALEEWKYKVMGTNFAPASYALYHSMGRFYPFKNLVGIRLYYRSSLSKILPPRSHFFKVSKPILVSADNLINAISPRKKEHSYPAGLVIQDLPFFDDESIGFIYNFLKLENFRRTKKELNWILEHPWILQTKADDSYTKKYHFSSNARTFKQMIHKVTIQGRLVAVLMSSFIDGKLLVPYIYYEDEHVEWVRKFIDNLAVEFEADTLTLFDKKLAIEFSENKGHEKFKKNFNKRFMAFDGIPKELAKRVSIFQGGDGDGAFT